MRLPAYYCPHCKRFKRWYQITNGDIDYGNCKHCGTSAVVTECIIEELIAEKVERDELIKKAGEIVDKFNCGGV